jgi:hypothetical protein
MVVAMTTPPSFFGQLWAYATHQELLEILFEREFLPFVEEASVDKMLELLGYVPFEPAMRYLSSLQAALWHIRLDPNTQLRLANEIYGAQVAAAAGVFLRRQERPVIFSEAQVFALQRLVVLHASEEPADSLDEEQRLALITALFWVPGLLLDPGASALERPPDPTDELWLRYFMGNGGLVGAPTPPNDIARAHRLYEVIAKSPAARRRHDIFCPIDDWLTALYSMRWSELQALGFTLHAGSQIMNEAAPPLSVRPNYYSSTAIYSRLEDGLTALSADRDWYRSAFEETQLSDERAYLETHPFLRRPGLRQGDGAITVISPRAIDSWLGSAGAFYRILDAALELGGRELSQRFLTFNGFLTERYARLLTHAAYPYPRRRTLTGSGRVSGEQHYRTKRGEQLTSDIVLDFGQDIVVVEVAAGRATTLSVVGADPTKIAADLRRLVIEKMRQLGRVINDLVEGRATITPPTGPPLDSADVKRIWPIVVSAENLFQNPALWHYVNERGGKFLALNQLPAQQTVMPLVLLDMEELEVLMALATESSNLVGILESKTSDIWRERDFSAWFLERGIQIGTGQNAFVTQEFARAMASVVRALDLGGRGRAAEAA